ncbi:MAG TPA: DUF4954 family protein [Fibrobacteria bacterium]|jgi:hypothetical protein|nr:DUF4954 family protein [Fibrobacteria bacterium]
MLSHDPVRTRLREALERSEAGKFLRESRAYWADSWSRARALTKVEIRGLEARGNRCADWSGVRILGEKSGEGILEGVEGCRFEGRVVLRPRKASGRAKAKPGSALPSLRASRIRDCLIGAAMVESVGLLDRVIVEDGATVRHVGECTGLAGSRFCLGLAVHPGDETGSRRVFLADGLLLGDCEAMAALPPAEQEALAHEWEARLRRCVTDHAFVGAGARLEHVAFVEDCFVGPGTVVRGASALRRCVIGSSGEDPVTVGDGVIAEECVLEAGTHLASSAQARRSLFLEHSGAEQAGHVAESVIGPNTTVAKGEVTASLVGPFVGFHHQALLIGALWPEGRGNVGYGANVGSNHTGRKPDQEIRPGEGVFFGLSTAVKFPADFSAAPYSLFATGVVAAPQALAFPFSLVAPGQSADHPGLNEIQPGWMWSDNAYALIRNAYKYADRDRSKLHKDANTVSGADIPVDSPLAGTFLASSLFSSRVAGLVRAGLKALEVVSSETTGVVTRERLPGLGANYAHAERLDRSRTAYANFLSFVALRESLLAGKSVPSGSKALLTGFMEAVEASLGKDAKRGAAVFGDYKAFHRPAAEDPVCVRLRADAAKLLRPSR